jgi:HEAT repeat protein
MAGLIESEPKRLLPFSGGLLAHRDPKVRALAVAALGKVPAAGNVARLADRLDDPHPEVRRSARAALRQFAQQKDLHDLVVAQTVRLLAAPSWRGQEQAAILLTQLEHRPAAGRLVELLTSPRPDVYITSAWALRMLDIPETLPAILRHVETETRRQLAGKPAPGRDAPVELVEHQLSQLNQFFGARKYEPADLALRQFVPKRSDKLGGEARAAGIWALGRLHENSGDKGLASEFEARLQDVGSIPPEDDRVRRMSAIALGQLKATAALPSLRKFAGDRKPSFDPVGNACAWAIAKIAGEAVPAPENLHRIYLDWFLSAEGSAPSTKSP